MRAQESLAKAFGFPQRRSRFRLQGVHPRRSGTRGTKPMRKEGFHPPTYGTGNDSD